MFQHCPVMQLYSDYVLFRLSDAAPLVFFPRFSFASFALFAVNWSSDDGDYARLRRCRRSPSRFLRWP
jgi:hypothetical protein